MAACQVNSLESVLSEPTPVPGPGPVTCDDSSDDDEEVKYSPPTLHAAPIIAVPGASPVHGPGPVQCDDSSDDDEEAGIYKVKV
eukprot:COSAG01_NODE_41287_length_453_cov_1.183616_2_plen_83_part_01